MVIVMNDTTTKLPAQIDDGFNDLGGNDERVIIGVLLRCIDGVWTGDGVSIPTGTHLLALATTMVLQHWQDKTPIETIRPKPGQTYTNLVDLRDDLNSKIDESTWEIGMDDQPRPPWVLSFIVYLLNPATAEKFTYVNSTTGARIAVLDLKDKVAWMRAIKGEQVVAEVELASKPMKTKRGQKMRPHFTVADWKTFDTARQPAQQLEPPRGIQPVEPPTLREEMKDGIDF
jgi:hypothetical protein